MEKKIKYWNYLIIFSLICLIVISFNKPKNNKLVITVKPLEGFHFNNPKNVNKYVINNTMTRYLISGNTKKKFTSFYLNQERIDEIKNIYKKVKIINKYQYYIIIIYNNEEKTMEENFKKIKVIIEDYSKKIILEKAEKLNEHFKNDHQRLMLEVSGEKVKDLEFDLAELNSNIKDLKIIIQDIKNNSIKFIQVIKS